MEEFRLSCWRFRGEDEVLVETMTRKGAGEQDPKVRTTRDILCRATPYYLESTIDKTGRRIVKFQLGRGTPFHIPARDLAAVLRELEYQVVDVR